MRMIKVESSNIAKVGYDQTKKVLSIQFESGKTYNYAGVPENVVLDLLFAESIGKYFNQEIKNKYLIKEEE